MSRHVKRNGIDAAASEAGTHEQATAVAVKQVIAQQIEREMRAQKITKTMMAEKMHTSRAALSRLLNTGDTGLTLTTLASAACALGRKLKVELAKR
jgi:antitoxin HicB